MADMRTFFDNIDILHRFTLELDRHRDDLACKSCSKSNQFVSHGFVYKKHSQGRQRTVGKRILCSNRYGKSGCGRTTRLYLSDEMPLLQYTAEHLFIFLVALLAGFSIHSAYTRATRSLNPRNAYRWLNKLQRKLMDYRNVLATLPRTVPPLFANRSRRLQLLLQTLHQLLSISPCQYYQQHHQSAFI